MNHISTDIYINNLDHLLSILPYLHKKAPATYTKYATEASL